jgi:hypothetical protein
MSFAFIEQSFSLCENQVCRPVDGNRALSLVHAPVEQLNEKARRFKGRDRLIFEHCPTGGGIRFVRLCHLFCP